MENKKTMAKKAMNIETAINRISWRFKNENIKVNESKIIINDTDVETVDFLVKWISNQKQEVLKDNLLFGKLYVYALENELEFYKDISFSNRKLQDVLKEPIENHYEKIVKDLNRLEYNKFCRSVGIITDHMEKMTLNQGQENQQQILIKQHQKELQKYIIGIWSVDSVYKSLNNQITECLNRYKNEINYYHR